MIVEAFLASGGTALRVNSSNVLPLLFSPLSLSFFPSARSLYNCRILFLEISGERIERMKIFPLNEVDWIFDGSLLAKRKKKQQILTRSIIIRDNTTSWPDGFGGWIEIYAKRAYVLTNLIIKLQGVPDRLHIPGQSSMAVVHRGGSPPVSNTVVN